MSTKRAAATEALVLASKRQRKMLTIVQKVELLDMLKEVKSYAAVGRLYGINESTVRYIKKEESKIRTTAAISFHKDAKRVVSVRNKTIVRMESALSLWIDDCRKNNVKLDTNIIRRKALKLYKTFADSEGRDDGEPGSSTSAFHAEPGPFTASKGWYDKFQKRFGRVSLQGEAASPDPDKAEEYVTKFKAIIEEGGYQPEQVFNMGETGLYWKPMPSRAFVMQGEPRGQGSRGPQDRLTLVMCGNAAGFMIKPGLIYASKNPRALKNNNKDMLPVYWMHNAKSWMTTALSRDWFKQCFVPEVKRYLGEKGLDFKVLLLVDNARGHADGLSYDGVQVEFLPPNTASLIQPMDQGIIRAFKALYAHNTLQDLVEARDSDQDFSLKAYWREYTIVSCLQNIQRVIQELETDTLNACWGKLWPEAVRNPTGCSPDEIHQSAVDTAVTLAQHLGADDFNDVTVTPDDIDALIETHPETLTDEDLADMTKPPSEDEGEEREEDTDVDEDEDVGLTIGRLATMVKMANELQRAAQEWDPVMSRSLQFANIIEVGISVYRDLLEQKKKQRQHPLAVFLARKKARALRPPVETDGGVEQREDGEPRQKGSEMEKSDVHLFTTDAESPLKIIKVENDDEMTMIKQEEEEEEEEGEEVEREFSNPVPWRKIEAEGLDCDYALLFSKEEADHLFNQLEEEVVYMTGEEAKVHVFGKKHDAPRKQATYGDEGLTYTYSGVTRSACPWTPTLTFIRDVVTKTTGHIFNFVLINRYKDGQDHMGEHRDDERELDPLCPIASVSLGAARDFIFRHRDARGTQWGRRDIRPVKLELAHGSLLLMNSPTNTFWYHSLPVRKKVHRPRINLTFRRIVLQRMKK